MKTRRYNQQGMVSIMVSMLMILVISLIVLGFSQISRREQRQTLDRQLSAQAFFAAESGVNDVRKVISAVPAGGTITEKTQCPPASPYNANPVIDTANNVSYSCLLVTTHLKDISGDLTTYGSSITLPFEPNGSAQTMHIVWKGPQSAATPAATSCNTPAQPRTLYSVSSGNWKCPYGMLRVDIVPTTTLSRAAMAAGQKTFFFYPVKANGTASQALGGTSGSLAAMNCSSGNGCSVDVTGMNAGGGAFALRLTAIYNDGNFDVSALDSGGANLELQHAQVQVDATGKAQDVLRRIQVRLPLAPTDSPAYAIESGSSICKRFEINADSFTIPSDIQGQDQKNPTCVPVAVMPPCDPIGNDIMMDLDTSKSMQRDWQGQTLRDRLKSVSARFVNNTTVGTYNHEGIVGFSGGPDSGGDQAITLFQPLTDDVPTLLTNINNLPLVLGTDYGPALHKAKYALDDGRPAAKKIIVFISDGNDAGDEVADIAYAQQLESVGVVIYTIGINGQPGAFRTLKAMTTPANFASAANPSDLDAIIDGLAADVRCVQ